QIFQIEADVVGRAIFCQHVAISIKNPSADGWDSDCSKRLGFQGLLIITRRNDLDPPQPAKQHAETAQDHQREHPQLCVSLPKLVENKHLVSPQSKSKSKVQSPRSKVCGSGLGFLFWTLDFGLWTSESSPPPNLPVRSETGLRDRRVRQRAIEPLENDETD